MKRLIIAAIVLGVMPASAAPSLCSKASQEACYTLDGCVWRPALVAGVSVLADGKSIAKRNVVAHCRLGLKKKIGE